MQIRGSWLAGPEYLTAFPWDGQVRFRDDGYGGVIKPLRQRLHELMGG